MIVCNRVKPGKEKKKKLISTLELITCRAGNWGHSNNIENFDCLRKKIRLKKKLFNFNAYD